MSVPKLLPSHVCSIHGVAHNTAAEVPCSFGLFLSLESPFLTPDSLRSQTLCLDVCFFVLTLFVFFKKTFTLPVLF